jgi:hypothetical protein
MESGGGFSFKLGKNIGGAKSAPSRQTHVPKTKKLRILTAANGIVSLQQALKIEPRL